ncbi:hypothetical protein L5515_001498 [Caenorhabditis briggsae]|uniref:PRORP domain-containing protein n=1 Tax=Caenorhabditis briggsae TaxID=6238 RepID=A0AAE9E5E8_CAEBR|nr:hypothetical protein L3Y34_015421 [Caenorhabditis briggsae]UMM13008.1 hypothetical protein L5515_001498 [Caenorhabditis briggsae]
MRYLNRVFRSLSTSAAWFFPFIPSKFHRPMLEMAPQFQFLASPSDPVCNEKTTQSLLAEVLRCHTYFDETVFLNTLKILSETKTIGNRTDGLRLAMIRYIGIVFHSIKDEKLRKSLSDVANKVDKCKIPTFKAEQELFFASMQPSENIPNFAKCMHKTDLIVCYFRRELEAKNWKNVRDLIALHPKFVPLYEHVDEFLKVAKHQKVTKEELLDVFMHYAQANNPYFVEEDDFNKVMKIVFKSYNVTVSDTVSDMNTVKKTYISVKEASLLKKAIDEYVYNSKEGFVKSKEYEKVAVRVREWKKARKLKDGKNVVVVDSLNFGVGRDPVEWNDISNQFQHVLFATRYPPSLVRDKVIKRYDGNALFCDKLSADDLIILRMALEFGPQTSLVTNDQYRDHRRAVCNLDPILEKIWDDFLIDAVYRHKDNCIEPRRSYNLRVRKINDRWHIPVLNFEGSSENMRNLKIYRIDT